MFSWFVVLQCVSFVTYVVLYFYALNILKNLKKIFKPGTTPWQIVSFLYYILRFKFIERIPGLAEYLNIAELLRTDASFVQQYIWHSTV